MLSQSIVELVRHLQQGEETVREVAEEAVSRIVAQASSNAFLHLDEKTLFREADTMDRRRRRGEALPPLFGLPVSVKDIFDVRRQPTSAGSRFLPINGQVARRDAAWVSRWRNAGALLIGKTHLNEFAYGITGENPWWGPCLQSDLPTCLTGGSSSGAAASVQGGSVSVGLGTDTGGSIRVPAALCSLVGYRASHHSIPTVGMLPLAASFDTCGWLQRHLSDFPFLYSSLQEERQKAPPKTWRIGFWEGPWVEECDAPIRSGYRQLAKLVEKKGAVIQWHRTQTLTEALDLFSPMQAFEAARVHRKTFGKYLDQYDPVVRARLEWGASISKREYNQLTERCLAFNGRVNRLWDSSDVIMAPACSLQRLLVQEDHADRRALLLRWTTPFSLGGFPILTFPWGSGQPSAGWQVVAPLKQDRLLCDFASILQHWLGIKHRSGAKMSVSLK